MRAARATGRVLLALRRRAGRVLARRSSLWAVAALVVLSTIPAATDRALPSSGTARDLAFDRVTTAGMPERALPRPRRERPRPSGVDRRPWPVLGRDTPDHLLARALGEIRHRDPAAYDAMRRQEPGWSVSLCDQAFCDRDVQGQTLVTSDGECLSSVDPDAATRTARRHRLPLLLWVADVLVHEHAHCGNVANEYSSIAAQLRFLDRWPASPGRERARAYVQRLYQLLDGTGNWRGR